MKTAWFEEVQRFRDSRWTWALLALLTLSIFLPLGLGAYQQLVLGEPWGNQPMKDQGLIGLMVFVTVCWGIAIFILTTMKLETRIDENGVHYRFFPLRPRWKTIAPGEIKNFAFETKYKLFDSGKIGHHYNVFKQQHSFKIWGGKHISISMVKGTRLLLGTQNIEGMEWAMKKLMKK